MKRTLAYAESWPISGGAMVTHHIYRDDSMPGGVMVHQHIEGDPAREIWVPDGVWERALKREREVAEAVEVKLRQKCGACRHARLFHRDGKPCGVMARMTDDTCGCSTFEEATDV